MKKVLILAGVVLSLCHASSIFAQSFTNPLSKERADNLFTEDMAKFGFQYTNAYYQVLSDSLAVISFNTNAVNGFGQTINASLIYFSVLYHESGKEQQWQGYYHYNDPFPSLFEKTLNPYIPKEQMMSHKNNSLLLSMMNYEDAMYYRFRYFNGLCNLARLSSMTEEVKHNFFDSFFQSIKTGFWICKSEFDEFGDPVGVVLSCPFYANYIKDGNVEEENEEFFLNISDKGISFTSDSIINYYPDYTLTIKDAFGNQLTCSLDDKLNITSNVSSFLRIIERGGIIKGNIKSLKRGKSYAFTIYTDGYRVAKSSIKH